MAVIIDIADAVVAELNGGTFSEAFTAERHYKPVFDLPEMKTLHVTVVPKGVDISAATRGLLRHDYQIDVAVQKKLLAGAGAGEATEIDGLMGLVEEIADFFKGRSLDSVSAVWVATENAPVYSPEHISELRQFTSVLTLTFRVLR